MTTSSPILPRLAALAAATLVFASCGADSSESAGQSSTRPTVVADASGATETEPRDAPASQEGIPLEPGPLVAGIYTTDVLGTEATFETESDLFAPVVDPGFVVLQWPDPPVEFTRAVLFVRWKGMSEDGPPTAPSAENLDAWLESNPSVTLLSREATSVSGADAVVYDLLPESGELDFMEGEVVSLVVREGERYRVWVVDQGEHAPLAIFSSVAVGDEDWLDTADAIVSTLGLGDPAPDPGPVEADVSAGPNGEWTAHGFGPGLASLSMELPEGLSATEHFVGFVTVEVSEWPDGESPAVVFLVPTRLADGTPIPDAATFRSLVEERGGTLVQNGSMSIFGEEVEGYDVRTGGSALGGISTAPVENDIGEFPLLSPSNYGTDFLIDTPAGLVIVATAAESEEDLSVAEDMLLALSRSMTLEQ